MTWLVQLFWGSDRTFTAAHLLTLLFTRRDEVELEYAYVVNVSYGHEADKLLDQRLGPLYTPIAVTHRSKSRLAQSTLTAKCGPNEIHRFH